MTGNIAKSPGKSEGSSLPEPETLMGTEDAKPEFQGILSPGWPGHVDANSTSQALRTSGQKVRELKAGSTYLRTR